MLYTKFQQHRPIGPKEVFKGFYHIWEWAVMWLGSFVVFVCWCFTALRHFSGHFGHGQLTCPHCSWASLLGSLPVLSAHSFASNWQLPFLTQRKEDMAVEIISWPNSMKECCRTWRSNPRPSAYQADVDPIELSRTATGIIWTIFSSHLHKIRLWLTQWLLRRCWKCWRRLMDDVWTTDAHLYYKITNKPSAQIS